MNKSIRTFAAFLALGSGVALFSTGCAGMMRGRSAGEVIDDGAITTKVKAALVKDPAVKAVDVKVQTDHGNVQLSGLVDTPDQKARAEQVARGISGVVGVQNNIGLKGQTTP